MAGKFRKLHQFDAGEKGDSIHVFDCFDHFRDGVWLPRYSTVMGDSDKWTPVMEMLMRFSFNLQWESRAVR